MAEQAISLSDWLEGRVAVGLDPALAGLLADIARPCTKISEEVNRAGLTDILGVSGTTNVHGEEVKKLDLYSDQLIIDALRQAGSVCGMASEEDEEIIAPSAAGEQSAYVALFDPLDGSSNIDVNISIGTIFSVFRRLGPRGSAAVLEDFLQPGSAQVAAGYVAYGSSTMLVLSTGDGVDGFTLDPGSGEYLLSHPSIITPARGSIYSCNEGNAWTWDQATRDYVDSLKDPSGGEGRPGSGRYVGSLVADFHRNLLKGGIFLYPAGSKKPGETPAGKLRLMYEANPMAMLAEQAGGSASDGSTRILDLVPTSVHQRTALAVGSSDNMAEYLAAVGN